VPEPDPTWSGARHGGLDVSVVIPCYNASDTLPEQLDALARQEFAGTWEVIISDNRSTDGTALLAERWQPVLPVLRVVSAPERKGVNYARNVGARAAAGRLIAFCDADDVVEPDWLSAMVQASERFDLVGGVMDSRHLNPPSVRNWYSTGLLEAHDAALAPDGRDRLDGATRLPDALDFLPYAEGNNLLIVREAFESLGGFDETFSSGGDDVEMSWRATLAGYRVGVAAGAVVRYRLRATLAGMAKQQYWFGKSAPRLYLKFRSLGVPARPVRLGLKSWIWLGLHATDLLAGGVRRGRWVRLLARAWGRLVGSIQLRVTYI
jgi:GT2 family glycosyltransferase